jgi:hypothetical protein
VADTCCTLRSVVRSFNFSLNFSSRGLAIVRAARSRRECSILVRGELVDPFDRHRGPTDVSHFFTLPLLSRRNAVILAKKYPRNRSLPHTRDHVPFHERMSRRPIVFRGSGEGRFGKTLSVGQLVSIDLASLISFSSFPAR